MGKQRSLRSKAVNLVSDFTTVLLNPISDKPSKKSPHVCLFLSSYLLFLAISSVFFVILFDFSAILFHGFGDFLFDFSV